MKASKLAALGVAVAAMMLALVPTAFAGKPPLLLEQEEAPVANGSASSIGVLLEDCGIFFNGKVTSNDAASDHVTGTTSADPECSKEVGATISGAITEATLASKGKASLKGSVTIKYSAGPCEYTFTKWKAKFEIPGFAFPEGENSGKLNKATSAPTCAKTKKGPFSFDITNEPFGEPFTTAFGA